jgi:hypothetical protein
MARFTTLTSNLVAKNAVIYGRPSNTDFAEYITGQAYSEKGGVLSVEECYDLPVFPALLNSFGTIGESPLVANTGRFEGHGSGLPVAPPTAAEIAENQEDRQEEQEKQEEELYKKWSEEGHWSICTFAEDEEAGTKLQQKAEFTVASGTTISFSTYAGAPMWRVSFTAGGADTKSVRIFARAFERGKV